MPCKVQKNEIRKASIILADAFQRDPLWNKIFENEITKSEKYPLVSELLLRYCFKYGEIFASSENFEGIMAWTPGKLSYMKMWRLIRSQAIFPFMKLGSNVGRRISLAFIPMETDRKKHMRQNSFIYLHIIGVSTKSQGKGHGGKLLQELNEMSDQAGIPIYLETETENNVRLYEKFGFKTLDQRILPVVNLPVWEMKREPE